MGMNEMTDLVNKIERRIGTKALNLPPDISKDKWADEVIDQDTLVTFSRYFPHAMPYYINTANRKDGFYLIDEGICAGTKVLGVRDINWHEFSTNSPTLQLGSGYGSYDFLSSAYDVEDASMVQMMADHTSLFSNGIYIDFIPPNKLKITSTVGGEILQNLKAIPIDLLIKHPKNLQTIEPTKMEIFEKLAIADVCVFLFAFLQHFDGLETVFANVDLKLGDIETKANGREEIVQYLEDNHVSAANKNQPVMFTIA